MPVNMIGLLVLIAGVFNGPHDPASVKNVYLSQGHAVFLLEQPTSKINVDREPFALTFFQRPYNNGSDDNYHALRIAVVLDRQLLNSVQVGGALDEIPMFQRGSGLAAEPGGYSSLHISEAGHHYVYYQNAAKHRAQLVEHLYNGFLKLSFPVNEITLYGKTYTLADAPTEVMFFTIVIDRNLDNVIQEGELTKIEVVF
jgi:hypothetical protein